VIAKTATLEDSAGTPNVTITGVVDVARRSRSRSLLSLTAGSGTKVTYTVVYTYDSAVTVVADSIRSNFISQLKSAITDGSLLTSLQSAVSSVFTASITASAADLSVSDVTVVVIERPLPTQNPTLAPDSNSPFNVLDNGGVIAGIVIGCVLVVSLVVSYFVLKYWNKITDDVTKETNVEKYAVNKLSVPSFDLDDVDDGYDDYDDDDDDSDDGIGMGVSIDDIGKLKTKKKNTRGSVNGRRRKKQSDGMKRKGEKVDKFTRAQQRNIDYQRRMTFFDIGGISPAVQVEQSNLFMRSMSMSGELKRSKSNDQDVGYEDLYAEKPDVANMDNVYFR
jgi:hypothetical protein